MNKPLQVDNSAIYVSKKKNDSLLGPSDSRSSNESPHLHFMPSCHGSHFQHDQLLNVSLWLLDVLLWPSEYAGQHLYVGDEMPV